MRLLILGGAAWLGGCLATTAVRRGHEVTCLARGRSGSVPAGAALVRADRDLPGAYDDVMGLDWDAVVDLSRQPGQVRAAVAALAGCSRSFVFISSANVYADHGTTGLDETASVLPPLDGDARDGSVLAPDVPELGTQVIDVRDLATWIVESASQGRCGVFDAAGKTVALGDHLEAARAVAGHTARVVAASQEWLLGQGVQPWMGKRSLPLWLPMPDYAGFSARDSSAARATGLVTRPLSATLTDRPGSWAWTRPGRGGQGCPPRPRDPSSTPWVADQH